MGLVAEVKDKGDYVVFRGVYEGRSGKDAQAAQARLAAYMKDSGYKIQGQLVPDGSELAFNLKIPKTFPDVQKEVQGMRKLMESGK
ncbi:MAG: hypothetical protein HY516_01120 [Candidatus Aenigmarchaeota archaeon]|nr:hypothetical protein [Candidatus Aenigmarchaeota archaeon]